MSDPSFDARLQRMFCDHPHYPDTPLFVADIENRLSRGWALRRAMIGAAGVAGGLIVTVQVAGAPIGERLGEALQVLQGAGRSVRSAADLIPGARLDLGLPPFGGEAIWLVAGLAVLAGALLASRSIQEL